MCDKIVCVDFFYLICLHSPIHIDSNILCYLLHPLGGLRLHFNYDVMLSPFLPLNLYSAVVEEYCFNDSASSVYVLLRQMKCIRPQAYLRRGGYLPLRGPESQRPLLPSAQFNCKLKVNVRLSL
jgi:hypothetical protein